MNEQTHVADWVSTVTAEARATKGRVFSVSVPIGDPASAFASEPLLAQVIDQVEGQGWRLESVSTYGSPESSYAAAQFCALLVFRSTYKGLV
ncbi:hypothetical protein ACFC4G_45290 [Streptomyces sp. NPDC056002]|uniref:hypothetical protein n=1 Tax=Streptomyces sp. NPDC056002 TaxID=3345675 RepID=UPI0035DEC633